MRSNVREKGGCYDMPCMLLCIQRNAQVKIFERNPKFGNLINSNLEIIFLSKPLIPNLQNWSQVNASVPQCGGYVPNSLRER